MLIAAGEKLSFSQNDVSFTGHSVECRINAEDPVTFMPSPGKVDLYHVPGGLGVRVDSHVYSGYTIPPYYDSMIAKVITTGKTREQAIVRMQGALQEMIVEGVRTNIPLQRRIMEDSEFGKGQQTIHYLENLLAKDKV